MSIPLQYRDERLRFSLAAVFEYTTLCALLCALSPGTGAIASVYLMLMALALGARQGLAALMLLAAALISADWRLTPVAGERNIQRLVTVMLLAALICGWYLLRRRLSKSPPNSLADKLGSADAVEIPLYEWTGSAWQRLR